MELESLVKSFGVRGGCQRGGGLYYLKKIGSYTPLTLKQLRSSTRSYPIIVHQLALSYVQWNDPATVSWTRLNFRGGGLGTQPRDWLAAVGYTADCSPELDLHVVDCVYCLEHCQLENFCCTDIFSAAQPIQ